MSDKEDDIQMIDFSKEKKVKKTKKKNKDAKTGKSSFVMVSKYLHMIHKLFYC